MYLGVDIGGTKTLVASLNNDGVIHEQYRFLTPTNYRVFIAELEESIAKLSVKQFKAATVAVPALSIDREQGLAHKFSNLPWRDVTIEKDVEDIIKCPVLIENDAKLAALSEAMLVKNKFTKVLYVTVSTGIGYGFVDNQLIDKNAGDGGGKTITLKRHGKHVPWESLASGHAIVEKYGKMAKDINDEETWQKIVADLAEGLIELISIFQPEVVVFGGSVGNYFDKYAKLLKKELKSYNLPQMIMPQLIEAGRPDEAVIYGCYDLAKGTYGHE